MDAGVLRETETYEVVLVTNGKIVGGLGKSEGFSRAGALRFADSANKRWPGAPGRYTAVKVTSTIEEVSE